MSRKTIAQLFGDKAAQNTAVLGNPLGKIEFDSEKDRHFQRFEHGILLGRFNNLASLSDLLCIHGMPFDSWWEKPGAAWLGDPLEDLYETKNFEGADIAVQRFENGVMWGRSDGTGEVHWLSWRDWHAISRPGDNKKSPP